MPRPPSTLKRNRRTSNLPPQPPETTPSGVVPGQALFDTPSPDHTQPELDRSQRARKASARKIESLDSQAHLKRVQRRARVLKRSVRRARASQTPSSTDDEAEGVGIRETGNSGASQSLADTGSSVRDNRMAGTGQAGDASIAFFSKDKVIYDLGRLLGQDVSHLSTQQLEKLVNAIPDLETDATTMGPQEQNPTAVVQPAAPLGLGGGYYCNRLEGTDSATSNSSQPADQPAQAGREPPALKRARFETDVDDSSATESESESEIGEPSHDIPPSSQPHERQRSTVNPPAVLVTSSGDRRSPDRPPAASGIQASASKAVANEDTATESETDESDTESESESDTEPSDLDCFIIPPPRVTIASTPSSSTRISSSAPAAPLSRDDGSNLANGPNPRPPTSASSTRPVNSTTGVAHADSAGHLLGRDVNAILNALHELTGTRARQQPPGANTSSSRRPQPRNTAGPSNARPNSTGGPAGVAAGARSRPNQERSLSEDPEEVLERAAAALLGKARPRRKKLALSDFPGTPRQIASAAIPVMQVSGINNDAYASLDTWRGWADDAYGDMWRRFLPNMPLETPPAGLNDVMGSRGSHFRSKLKERLRPPVRHGFGFKSPVLSKEDKRHNKLLVKKLKPDTFHCRDLIPDTDQYEHPVFLLCIAEGYFWDKDAIGVVFYQKFNPISLPAACLILTMMQFCIEEWKSGHYEAHDLDVKDQANVFDAHMAGLEVYGDQAAVRLDNFQQMWYNYGMTHAGVVAPKRRRITQPTTQPENVRPDTPPAV